MNKMKIIIPLLLLLVACKTPKEKEKELVSKVDLAITNVTLIDGTGSEAQENVSVLINDGRIIGILQNENSVEAESIINGKGKYLIPGLFDNHIHIGYDSTKFSSQMEQLIHFGVTTILIPGADNGKLLTFKKLIKEKALTAPNIYHTSLMTTMEGKHPMKTYGAENYTDGININLIKDTADVQRIVNQAVADKAIAIKLMIEDGPGPPFVERIPEPLVAAISNAAEENKLDFFAHVSDMDEVKIAAKYKVDALMHYAGVQVSWETDKETIEQLIDNKSSWVTTSMIGKSFHYPLHKEWTQRLEFDVYDEDQTDYFSDADGTLEAEARAVMKDMLGSDQIPMQAMMTPTLTNLKKMFDMGLNVVVGTDVRGRPYILPGISVHEEMEMLAMGGFTAEEIIRCATLNAARMLKIDKDYGTLEAGKIADMILLDKNPLEDITNTLTINTVWKNGKEQPRIKSN